MDIEQQQIECVKCGWQWNTKDSDESDKYVCHKCGFDNTLFYETLVADLFKPTLSTQEIAKKHNAELKYIENQLHTGIIHELEHTDYNYIAKKIALHHLAEMPNYYEKLKGIEDDGNQLKIKVGDSVVEYRKPTPNQPKREYGGIGKVITITDAMAKVDFGNHYETWIALRNLKKVSDKLEEGGVVVGKRHSEMDENGETGERFVVESTGQLVELEGGEGVLCKESMSSDKKYSFQGKKMTSREIASFLNHKYGGVEFSKGGKVNYACSCKSRYYHGGELPSAKLDSLAGGEAVVTVKTMESDEKYNFGNKMMTPRQILSKINAEHGGKKFEEGGTIDFSDMDYETDKQMAKMVFFTEKVLYF
jgi:hypothetical protein